MLKGPSVKRGLGRVIGLKVEVEDPITVENLATQLAEAMQGESLLRADAAAFRTQAASERTKASDLQHVIFQLKDRARNPPAKVRRMDPLAEYDLEMCEEELEGLKSRAKELDEMASDCAQKADRKKAETARLQAKIRERNEK